YEEFLRDPSAVGPEWRRLFESGVVGEKPNGADGAQRRAGTDFPSRVAFEVGAVDPGRRAAAEPAPAGTTTAPEQATEPDPGRQPARLPASASQIKGPAATTLRTIAVATLEARRKELNSRLQTAGRKEKLSFTHLIAFALVQAAKRHPVMGHTLLIQDGVPYRVQPEGIGLGLAVDVQRKDGSRGLVVPVIKRADTMDFGAFHAAYEALVEKAR